MSASATALPEKATHQQTRTFNQQLVLRALHDHSPLSRADLARLTGLTRTSVGGLVGALLDEGLIEEAGRGRSSGGKSPILLRVAPNGRHLIGLDLGEGEFSGAIVNLHGEILDSIHVPLEGRNGDATVELVFQLVDALRANDRSPLLGIGIGAPGIIDTSTGTVRWSVNLNWADLRLGPLLEERYGVPVIVANDSHAAALAELTFLRPRPNSLIVIKVGRGVGAGIILNGQLFQGDGYGAGEFGHVSICGAHAPCRCGREGCLETMTSMRSLVDAARAVEPSITDEPGLVAAYQAGAGNIRRIVLDAARELGIAVGWMIGVLNVRHVLLVGPVAEFGDDWLGEVRRCARSSVLALLARDTLIEFGHVHDDVVVLGASALLMEQQLGLGLAR
jgi:N-acetylglucosamine repressor